MTERTCGLDDCDDRHYAKGYCRKHYWLWRKHGDPRINLRPDLKKSAEQRFWEKVNKDGAVPAHRPELGPCWIWTGAVNTQGYGALRVPRERKTVGAHRWGYQTFVGPIPDGLHLDHLCRTPLCVRPGHLEPVTPAENMRRGNSRGARYARTGMCDKGHSFADAYVMADGARRCRQCEMEDQWHRVRDPDSKRHRRNKPAKFRHLTATQAREIKAMWAAGGMTQREIAAHFGCSQPTVSDLVNGKRDANSTHRVNLTVMT